MSHLSFILRSGILVPALAWQVAPAQNAANTPATQSPAPARPQLSAQERGDIQMARKMYREAIETYKEAPETAVLMNKIGIAYHQLADLGNAEKCYSRAVKLDPKYTEAMNNLGTIYYSRQSYRRAINQYKKVLRVKPDSASTLANLGSAYFARKQYELASENYQKALAIDPNVFESRSGTGSVVRDRTVGDRPTFFYYLAKSYAKAGMFEQALNYIRKSLEEGFKERKKFMEEPEFAGLQKDPEFQKLMAMEPKVL
jgi:tetratricopeptide (TPR) repeat protein